jgi:ATP-binding cassette subfamily C (CFTR/MRP) protein 1
MFSLSLFLNSHEITALTCQLAGEMRRTAGTSAVVGNRAFCPQVAWIQNATVRDNITFGKPFDQVKYDRVVEACGLSHDLQILPHGSFTEIGERGINLSGGQKHRVSLARAIYFDSDIILLDDPLAAVDAHVGAHIMDRAICGVLKSKCRILATHQLQVLPRCDKIAIMESGRITAYDTFENLMGHNSTFQVMMATVDIEERKKPQVVVNNEVGEPLQREKSIKLSQEALMQEEDRAAGSIPWAVYMDYFKSTGSLFIPILVFLSVIVAQGTNILTSLWLAWWSDNHFNMSTGKYVSPSPILPTSNVRELIRMDTDCGICLTWSGSSYSSLFLWISNLSFRNGSEQKDAPTSYYSYLEGSRLLL